MDTFKTSFRGYNKAEVDKVLKEQGEENETLARQNQQMQAELSDLRVKLQVSEALVAEQKDEIARSSENLRMMRLDMESILDRKMQDNQKDQSPAKELGGLYIRAYEFGMSIADETRAQTETYLSALEDSAANADRNLDASLADFADSKQKIMSLIGAMNTEIENILGQLEKVEHEFDASHGLFKNVDTVRKNFEDRVNELSREYESTVNEYNPSESKAEPKVESPKETPKETRGVDSIVVTLPLSIDSNPIQKDPEPSEPIAEEDASAQVTAESKEQSMPEQNENTEHTEDDGISDFRDPNNEGVEAMRQKLNDLTVRHQTIASLLSKYQNSGSDHND